MKKIKLCPFCGSEAVLWSEPYLIKETRKQDMLYFVQCVLRECQCRTNSWYPERAAIDAWNRRT